MKLPRLSSVQSWSAGKPIRAAATEELDATLVTIPNVEIVSAGTYDLASGKTTFTQDDLASAVAAAADDAAVPTPRLKIGHTTQWGDGEPSFGSIVNMHLTANGMTIVGDFVGVPKWLADIMPTAYPSRSIEGNFGVLTASGKKHSMVISAVALLGVVAPGVSDLEDLTSLYGAEKPEDVEVLAGSQIIAKEVGGDMRPVHAASVEDVRRAFYDGLDADQMWWWIRSIELEPDQLIADDDTGSLYRVPFSVSGDEITFDDPIEVRIEYVDVTESSSKVAASRAIVYASRSESRPEDQPKEDDMDLKEIRERLGLPDDASEDDVKAFLDKAKAEAQPETPPAEGDESDETGEEPASEDEAGTEDKPPSGTVTVDSEEYAKLQAGAAAGLSVKQQMDQKDKSDTIAAAVQAGKFAPARKAHYESLWDHDPEGTKKLLTASVEDGGLAPNTVPVEETGTQGDDTLAASDPGYDPNWLSPGERARIAAAKNGEGPGPVTQERVGS